MKISIHNLHKNFGNFTALDNINIVFKDGQFTTLLGPSGCGKTTLLRIIAGLETADRGEIYFDDTCVFSSEKNINVPPEKRGLGFVFQDFALWPHMTVFENVAFGLRASKQTNNLKARVEEALRAVRLNGKEKNYPHELSGGQQQRVAFARAIVIEPKCILFDEPLSALDAILREEMRYEIKQIMNKRGITSIFVTHDQLEAMSMSDSVAVILQGKIAQHAEPETIYQRPVQPEIAKFIGHANWFNEKEMVRPEKMKIVKKILDSNVHYEKMRIREVNFLGEHYEVMVENEKYQWLIPTEHKYSIGEEIYIQLDKNDIVTF